MERLVFRSGCVALTLAAVLSLVGTGSPRAQPNAPSALMQELAIALPDSHRKACP